MVAEQGSFDSNGTEIRYLDWGPPPGGLASPTPLLLIHATGFLAALWQPIAERLSTRFRVLAMDQRGHGHSGKPAAGYSFEVFADDLQRMIESLNLQTPIAVGHSSGATTIVAHAARYPGVIERAVLIEPILPRPDWFTAKNGERTPFSMAENARKRRAVWPNREELFQAYRSRPVFESWDEESLRIYVDEGTRELPDGQAELLCPPELEALFFEAAAAFDAEACLPKLSCPTLTLWGAESHLRGRMESFAAETLPNARSVAVADTTHFLPQERPAEVVRLLEEYLSD